MPQPLLGHVVHFDAGRGLGEAELEGGARYSFHATSIADGSRSIQEGQRVAAELRAGHRGRLELFGLHSI
jgi:cold shock CspA family protein